MSSRSALLLPYLLSLGACDSAEPFEPTRGCDSSSDCQLFEVCHVPNNECLPEPEQRLLGQFYCDEVKDAPGGDVVGSFSEIVGYATLDDPKGGRTLQRMNLNTPPICILANDALSLAVDDVELRLKGVGTYLALAVPADRLVPGSLEDVSDPVAYRAFLANCTKAQLLVGTCVQQGGDARTLFFIDRAPVVGSPLRGFVDISVVEIPPP
jgi:hypothetical protein